MKDTCRVNLPSHAFGGCDLGEAIESALGEGRHGSLRADFHSLERTESDIGKELCRGGSAEVKAGLVLVRILFASQIGVELLEVFVSAILERSLGLSWCQRDHPARRLGGCRS